MARGGETLVAALVVEHHREGFVVPLLILSDAPGLIEWDPTTGLVARDDRGTRYTATLVSSTSGLGQLVCAVRCTPDLPPEVERLELVVDGIMRINPSRGAPAGVNRAVSGGPWNLVIDLRPPRTVAEVPPLPQDRRRPPSTGSVPARTASGFIDLVPVGQVRLRDGVAVCAVALERYRERSVLTLSALGSSSDVTVAPAIARAAVDVWDDCGCRYRTTPVHEESGDSVSEVSLALSPALDPAARVLAIHVAQVPRGDRAESAIGEPVTFAVTLPEA